MITLRRAKERQHQRHRKQETWLTFSPHDLASPLVDGFGIPEQCRYAEMLHPEHLGRVS